MCVCVYKERGEGVRHQLSVYIPASRSKSLLSFSLLGVLENT